MIKTRRRNSASKVRYCAVPRSSVDPHKWSTFMLHRLAGELSTIQTRTQQLRLDSVSIVCLVFPFQCLPLANGGVPWTRIKASGRPAKNKDVETDSKAKASAIQLVTDLTERISSIDKARTVPLIKSSKKKCTYALYLKDGSSSNVAPVPTAPSSERGHASNRIQGNEEQAKGHSH